MRIPDTYLPWRFYGFDPELLRGKLLSDMSAHNIVKTERVAAAWRDLNWDSKHFNCKMLELKYFIGENDATFEDRSNVMRELHKNWQGFDHVTARINAFDISSAQVVESFGFSLMDTNVRYGIDLRKADLQKFEGSKFTVDEVIYEAVNCPCNLSELIGIAETSWSQTRVATDRFHADKGFPKRLADSVYTEWLRNSLSGELADLIVVPRVDGRAVGFLTLKRQADCIGDTRFGLLVLAAVDPSMRGKNIYTNMISFGLRILKRDTEIVETGTQVTNYPVQKAWVQLGLKLVSTTYTFHKWLTG